MALNEEVRPDGTWENYKIIWKGKELTFPFIRGAAVLFGRGGIGALIHALVILWAFVPFLSQCGL